MAVEERVRALHPLVASEALALRDLERLGELYDLEVGGSHCSDLPRSHELVEGAQSLLLRNVRIELVREVERHPLEPEPPQADVDLPKDASPRQPAICTYLVRVEGLRLDHDRVADRAVLRLQPPADEGLAPTSAVRVGSVERRDPELPGAIHDPEGLVLGDPLPEELGSGADSTEVSAAEDDAGDRDPASPELSRLHECDPRPCLYWA